MHMASILVQYGFRWHSDKPYQTRLRLVRYDLSDPYRTQMDAICISYLELFSSSAFGLYAFACIFYIHLLLRLLANENLGIAMQVNLWLTVDNLIYY